MFVECMNERERARARRVSVRLSWERLPCLNARSGVLPCAMMSVCVRGLRVLGMEHLASDSARHRESACRRKRYSAQPSCRRCRSRLRASKASLGPTREERHAKRAHHVHLCSWAPFEAAWRKARAALVRWAWVDEPLGLGGPPTSQDAAGRREPERCLTAECTGGAS